jgi:hypothetical protein
VTSPQTTPRSRARRIALTLSLTVLSTLGCAPRAGKLSGSPTPARFPNTDLAKGHQQVVFRWEYVDLALAAKGEGVARIASPDSVRLDFYLDGGLGGGFAILIGDSLTTPGGDDIRRYLPPPPLLWATLGRLRVPSVADTSATVDGDAVRADIGRNPTWRVTFVSERLTRLERIVDGRRLEWVSRTGTDVRYQNERSSRSLSLKVSRTNEVAPFDSDIWRR